MKWVLLPSLFILFVLISCHRDPVPMSALDLQQYGIPMIIRAPDSAEVILKDYTFMRDITIRKLPGFDIQVFELTAPSGDAAGEKLHQLSSVREDPFFRALLHEDEYGFIYSKALDSVTLDYDFRLVKLLGDKELIFQTGLAGSFTLEQVEWMYNSVK
ncbi:MAG TPA: hypothetical protein VFV79_09705 [Saprospiraceae bacterium]|nr:hypothetical protein [Saprospiraceae bacterium]